MGVPILFNWKFMPGLWPIISTELNYSKRDVVVQEHKSEKITLTKIFTNIPFVHQSFEKIT